MFFTRSLAVSIFYDAGHDLTHTLKKMEEQLLKFAVNVLFNRFDLLDRSPGRTAVAIYYDVGSGVGIHPLLPALIPVTTTHGGKAHGTWGHQLGL